VCPDGSAIIFPINGVRVRTDRIFPAKTVNQSVWCEIYVDHERGTWNDLEATKGVFVFLKNGCMGIFNLDRTFRRSNYRPEWCLFEIGLK
jgi:hypothetical protein